MIGNDDDASGPAKRERLARYRRGRWSEIVAAVWLTLHGYRIVARGFRTRAGEIDLIAVRGRVVAFIEVKRRTSLIAAEGAVSPRQRQRIANAAVQWIGRNPRYREHEQRLDVVFMAPRRMPVHIPGGL